MFKLTALNPQLCAAPTHSLKVQNTQNVDQPCPQQFTEHIEQVNSDNLPHTHQLSVNFSEPKKSDIIHTMFFLQIDHVLVLSQILK